MGRLDMRGSHSGLERVVTWTCEVAVWEVMGATA
jgi:hypothetical protein